MNVPDADVGEVSNASVSNATSNPDIVEVSGDQGTVEESQVRFNSFSH